MLYYKHLKTGAIYRYLATGVDCTNIREGALVVIYCPDDDEHTIYVREESEFYEKFMCLSEV